MTVSRITYDARDYFWHPSSARSLAGLQPNEVVGPYAAAAAALRSLKVPDLLGLLSEIVQQGCPTPDADMIDCSTSTSFVRSCVESSIAQMLMTEPAIKEEFAVRKERSLATT